LQGSGHRWLVCPKSHTLDTGGVGGFGTLIGSYGSLSIHSFFVKPLLLCQFVAFLPIHCFFLNPPAVGRALYRALIGPYWSLYRAHVEPHGNPLAMTQGRVTPMGPGPGPKGSWIVQKVLGTTDFPRPSFKCLGTAAVTRAQEPHRQMQNEKLVWRLSFSAYVRRAKSP